MGGATARILDSRAGVRALLGVLLAVGSFVACEQPPPAPPPVAIDVEFEVLNPDRPEPLRCNPEVRIARKTSPGVLSALARRLLEGEAEGCDFGLAVYYLPGMRPGSGAWAIAELGPEGKATILGLSAADEQALIERTRGPGVPLGVWVDDTSYASVVALHRDGGGVKLGRWYPDGGTATRPIKIVKSASGPHELHDAAAVGGRRYRIGRNGDLESWDAVGFLSAARKVRVDVDLAALAAEDVARREQRARVATAGSSLRRAAAVEERWRKFAEWVALYRQSLDPARHLVLELGSPLDDDDRSDACARLAGALAGVPDDPLRAAPSDRIHVEPLLDRLTVLSQACARDRPIQVLLEAAATSAEWKVLDRVVEQVVSELQPEEE
jgi:hypothetical protein